MVTGTRPQVMKECRYSICETCRILGIHRHTLAKYTQMGVIVPIIHLTSSRIYYTGAEILRFWRSIA